MKALRLYLFVVTSIVLHSTSPLSAATFSGYYEVPVARNPVRPIVNDLARFLLTEARTDAPDPQNANRIDLMLPAELVGKDYTYKVARVPGTDRWFSKDLNEINCRVENHQTPFDLAPRAYFSCFMDFDYGDVDLEKVETVLTARHGLTGQDLLDRLTVAQSFRDEHIGIVRIPISDSFATKCGGRSERTDVDDSRSDRAPLVRGGRD